MEDRKEREDYLKEQEEMEDRKEKEDYLKEQEEMEDRKGREDYLKEQEEIRKRKTQSLDPFLERALRQWWIQKQLLKLSEPTDPEDEEDVPFL